MSRYRIDNLKIGRNDFSKNLKFVIKQGNLSIHIISMDELANMKEHSQCIDDNCIILNSKSDDYSDNQVYLCDCQDYSLSVFSEKGNISVYGFQGRKLKLTSSLFSCLKHIDVVDCKIDDLVIHTVSDSVIYGTDIMVKDVMANKFYARAYYSEIDMCDSSFSRVQLYFQNGSFKHINVSSKMNLSLSSSLFASDITVPKVNVVSGGSIDMRNLSFSVGNFSADGNVDLSIFDDSGIPNINNSDFVSVSYVKR